MLKRLGENREPFLVPNLRRKSIPSFSVNNSCGFSVVQSLSRVWVFTIPWTAARKASLSFTISQSFLEFMSIMSQWCHPTISSSAACLSFCPQSLPASGSFSMNQLFASGGQSIRTSASASVLPKNIQGWFPLGLTVLFSHSLFSEENVLRHKHSWLCWIIMYVNKIRVWRF